MNRKAVMLLCAAALLVCFPPMRKSAYWRSVDPAKPAGAITRYRCDRFLFGYLPHHDWVGRLGVAVDMSPGSQVTLYRSPAVEARAYRFVVDEVVLALELIAIGIVVFLAPPGRIPLWLAGSSKK